VIFITKLISGSHNRSIRLREGFARQLGNDVAKHLLAVIFNLIEIDIEWRIFFLLLPSDHLFKHMITWQTLAQKTIAHPAYRACTISDLT
jgi:hypothetical protein